MPYAPPVDIATFYDEDTLDHLFQIMHGHEWAIHLIGPDEIHYNVDFEKPEDDPDNPELTQRTALKTAAELNAFVASQERPDEDPPLMYHSVVFHHGEPWVPAASDGKPGEYCEWFDFNSHDWFCNQCFEVINGAGVHCPTCAPAHFPGLMRVPCDAEPNTHPAIFMYADNTEGYSSAYCWFCIRDHQQEVTGQGKRLRLERMHASHAPWRRWKLTGWLLKSSRRMGLVAGYTTYHAKPCLGCVYDIHWRWSR